MTIVADDTIKLFNDFSDRKTRYLFVARSYQKPSFSYWKHLSIFRENLGKFSMRKKPAEFEMRPALYINSEAWLSDS